MSEFLNTKLSAIRSGDILALVSELDAVCGERSPTYLNMPFRFFLSSCVYPGGTNTKRVKFSTATVLESEFLDSTIGKLPADLFDLCHELCRRAGPAREFSLGQKLVTFLNRTIDVHTPDKPPTDKQRRREALAQQQRRNRS